MNKTIIINNNNEVNNVPINVMTTESLIGNIGGNSVKANQKIHAGVDAGNGYFKYYFQNFTNINPETNKVITERGFFESVLDIDTNRASGDVSEGDVVFINGHACKINSGKRVGERREAFTKQNEYTRANFYYALLQMYISAMRSGKGIINDFYVALGTTTDIFKDEEEREEYRQYMLGNIDYDIYGKEPLNGKITFRYYNEDRHDFSDATINIKELIIQPEGTTSLLDLDVKEVGFSFDKKTIILDLGSQTSHVITYNKRTAGYKIDPNREGGYIHLIERLIRPLSKKALTQFSYEDAEVEFKRRNDKEFKAVIDKAVEKYIKEVVVSELEKANVQYGRDQIVVTGGTSVKIREDLEKYFLKHHKTQLMFVKDGFYANAKGLLMNLNRELKNQEQARKVAK